MPKHSSKEFDQLLKQAEKSGIRWVFKQTTKKYIVFHPNGKDMYIFHKADKAVPILRDYIIKCETHIQSTQKPKK